jgi:hypothetical protein
VYFGEPDLSKSAKFRNIDRVDCVQQSKLYDTRLSAFAPAWHPVHRPREPDVKPLSSNPGLVYLFSKLESPR